MTSFLFASDSFKGSLSSPYIASLLEQEAHRAFPEAQCKKLIVADGGEGTVEAVLSATGGARRQVTVTGPLGEPVEASFGLIDGERAIVELASSSGLTLVPESLRDAGKTTSFGFGEQILAAIGCGAREIFLALGGSATNDGGMGALEALGAAFVDASGEELHGCGDNLGRVDRVDLSGMDERLAGVRFVVMSDVTNPLLGEKGATRVFGPQKGADENALERLELGMASYARCMTAACGADATGIPGTGAAGGMGFAAIAGLGAEVVSGIDALLDLVDFDRLLEGVDICFSGEGHADSQSVDGKVLSGIARRCQRAGVPLIAIVGGMDDGACALHEIGVTELVACVGSEVPLREALAHAEENYRRAAAGVFERLAERGGEESR